MKVCIIGWYGTETLGDISILEGLINIFENLTKKNHFSLGSLYPFYTERTLYLEETLFDSLTKGASIECFNIKDKKILKNKILDADLVIMGGGPLLDILELKYIENSFKYAKTIGKKTAILGCGIGPLNIKCFRKSVYNILKYSDLIILRDHISKKEISVLNKEFNNEINESKVFCSFDPAIIPIKYFEKSINKNNQIVINLRDYPFKTDVKEYEKINKSLIDLINVLSERFSKIILLPNHTFFIGGDDRSYFSKLKLKLKNDNIEIVHEPKTLFEVFEIISSSEICIGMRYHSILFQTLLNGNNYILDYTDPKKGKIISFLEMIDKDGFYENRYFNIINNIGNYSFSLSEKSFVYDIRIFDETIDFYKEKIKELF